MKLRSDSFAARLTAIQRDELFAALAGGKSYEAGAEWVKERSRKRPSPQAVGAWFAGARAERTIAAAREVALVTEANCPSDYDAQTRRALGQQEFLAVMGGLTARDVAALKSVDIAQQRVDLDSQKLDLDRQKLAQDQRVTRRDLALDRTRILLERVRGGEKGAGLQSQIDLALEEIQRLKTGEDVE